MATTDYREHPAPVPLRQHLSCVWTATVPAAAPAVARVLPDACLDLMCIDDQLVVAGPDTGPAPTTLPAGTRIVGVRFRPGAAPGLLGVPSDELRDQRVPLHHLWDARADRLAEAVVPAMAVPGAALRVLTDTLVGGLPHAGAPDTLVTGLAAELGRSDRRPGMAAVAARLGVSERQLHRRCVSAVGYRPKLLDRVLRLRRFLALSGRAGPSFGLADLAHAAGYADQTHLTRECRVLAACTPSRLVDV